MDPGRAQLVRFLARARTMGLRRVVLATLADAALGAAAGTMVGALIAGLTLRGDVIGPATALALAAWLAILLSNRVATGRRSWGQTWRVAGTIARAKGPLRRAPSNEPGDAVLRHEILGATELLLALEDERDSLRSPVLAARYVEEVGARVADLEPGLAGPRTRWRPRLAALGVLLAVTALLGAWPGLALGTDLMLSASDGRPPQPPRPVWSSLSLELDYPPHTGRSRRAIPNPSGALRVPAGTHVHLRMTTPEPAAAARIVVAYDADEIENARPPVVVVLEETESEAASPGSSFSGSFVVRGPGSWTIVLLDGDEQVDQADRRSAPLPLRLEPDRPPEVELLPLPRWQQEASEKAVIDIRFLARDDFGLASTELVYQLPGGETFRQSAGKPPKRARSWQHRHGWDLSAIPIEDRSEVLYWIEVRDNDPGLGLDPLPDPPGKVTRSATMRLLVRDDESEHAVNIVYLRAIRDAAVDLLGTRMTTAAFSRPGADSEPDLTHALPIVEHFVRAREIAQLAGDLLAALAAAVDQLSVDTIAHERDVATLAEIHGRLMKLHRGELKLHEQIPPGSELVAHDELPPVFSRLERHNRDEIRQLEDEIIRLDDLVDGMTIERLEALVARLQATQQKLVDLLEQARAGDTSVVPQIEQLEQRRREDLRRVAEARAALRKEVGREHMNLDAFDVLESMQQAGVGDLIQEGRFDDALKRARGELDEIQGLRNAVQKGMSDPDNARLSPEEKKRMELLRRLSRIQDEQGSLRARTRGLHQGWREAVQGEKASKQLVREVARRAAAYRRRMDAINDARLGRDARRGLSDAKEALDVLTRLQQEEEPQLLEAAEAADRAARAMQPVVRGSKAEEAEGKAARELKRDVQQLRDGLMGRLPPPDDVLDQEKMGQFGRLHQGQAGLRGRTDALLEEDIADLLPEDGRRAVQRASRAMDGSGGRLLEHKTTDAIDGQTRAWDAIQQALDSLRRGGSAPPSGDGEDASTEAERDRALRDELLEAMREGAPNGYDEAVRRYYEELLR